MYYERTSKNLVIDEQHGKADEVKVEGYIDVLKQRFPDVEVTIGRSAILRRRRFTLTFATVADAEAAEEFIDND